MCLGTAIGRVGEARLLAALAYRVGRACTATAKCKQQRQREPGCNKAHAALLPPRDLVLFAALGRLIGSSPPPPLLCRLRFSASIRSTTLVSAAGSTCGRTGI